MNDNGCNNECSSCGESCSSGGCSVKPQSFIEQTHKLNKIKRVIGVVSGKGGVGKSMVTSILSVMMSRRGYNVGILDADITGPSIPKVFGVNQKAVGSQQGIYPQKTKNGINVMSVNLLLENTDDPVVWRGPMIAGVVKQFWTDVIWGDVDFLFLDMPPGTGDVPLTVFQSIPLDGIVIVTSPQDLVSMIVKKAYNMAKEMNIPILGIVENMSYLKCPDCGKEIKLFGESKIESIAEQLGIEFLGKMPIDPELAGLCDKGQIENISKDYLTKAVSYIEKKFIQAEGKKTLKIAIPTEGNSVSSHFGKCENFTIIEIEDSSIKSRNTISTIGNQHGLLPAFLLSYGVNTVIAGGMGDGARENLNSAGIEIISGVTGTIDDALNAYLNGTLESQNIGCTGHDHSHEHGNHDSGCNCGHH